MRRIKIFTCFFLFVVCMFAFESSPQAKKPVAHSRHAQLIAKNKKHKNKPSRRICAKVKVKTRKGGYRLARRCFHPVFFARGVNPSKFRKDPLPLPSGELAIATVEEPNKVFKVQLFTDKNSTISNDNKTIIEDTSVLEPANSISSTETKKEENPFLFSSTFALIPSITPGSIQLLSPTLLAETSLLAQLANPASPQLLAALAANSSTTDQPNTDSTTTLKADLLTDNQSSPVNPNLLTENSASADSKTTDSKTVEENGPPQTQLSSGVAMINPEESESDAEPEGEGEGNHESPLPNEAPSLAKNQFDPKENVKLSSSFQSKAEANQLLASIIHGKKPREYPDSSWWHAEKAPNAAKLDLQGKQLNPQAIDTLQHLFRCKRSGHVREINPQLFVLLSAVYDHFGKKPLILVSGHRLLDSRGHESSGSYHRLGSASDILIPGVSIQEITDFADNYLDAGKSGVGIYPNSGFVHLDLRPDTSYHWVDYSGGGGGHKKRKAANYARNSSKGKHSHFASTSSKGKKRARPA